VTRANGFIAGHCIEELLTHGYAVRSSVRNPATADVAHLHALAQRTGGSLELVAARLDADVGWAEAVAGCTYVWRVASPNPLAVPKDADDLIRLANDGTLRVLRAPAASTTVRRVVLTSSTDAITHGHPASRVHTEADWSDPDRSWPYPRLIATPTPTGASAAGPREASKRSCATARRRSSDRNPWHASLCAEIASAPGPDGGGEVEAHRGAQRHLRHDGASGPRLCADHQARRRP
jgi:nucleoside-diphosphate-sugar epimerase